MSKYYKVKKTLCYPNSWKIVPKNGFYESNDTSLFFPTEKEAETRAIEMDRIFDSEKERRMRDGFNHNIDNY